MPARSKAVIYMLFCRYAFKQIKFSIIRRQNIAFKYDTTTASAAATMYKGMYLLHAVQKINVFVAVHVNIMVVAAAVTLCGCGIFFPLVSVITYGTRTRIKKTVDKC